MRWFVKRNLQSSPRLTICVIDSQCNKSIRLFWQILPLNPSNYIIRIRNSDFDLDFVPVGCLRIDVKVNCESMSVELRSIQDPIELKSMITASHRQICRLKHILSIPHQILLEVSDIKTDAQVEVIHLRTAMFGRSTVQNVREPPIELTTIVQPKHLYPTLPARRGSLQ